MDAIFSTPCDSVATPLDSSGADVEELRGGEVLLVLEGRDDEKVPVVVNMAPVVRSRTIVAFTPGFFESRPNDSASWSVPLVVCI
jgi:hypothetical protein